MGGASEAELEAAERRLDRVIEIAQLNEEMIIKGCRALIGVQYDFDSIDAAEKRLLAEQAATLRLRERIEWAGAAGDEGELRACAKVCEESGLHEEAQRVEALLRQHLTRRG